jgi:predicted transcriptional regulator
MQKAKQAMNGSIHPDELLMFFKAMADANRLKILGLLAKENLSVEQLAGLLNLRSSTISHHLAILSEAGWYARPTPPARAESPGKIAQHLLAKETLHYCS